MITTNCIQGYTFSLTVLRMSFYNNHFHFHLAAQVTYDQRVKLRLLTIIL